MEIRQIEGKDHEKVFQMLQQVWFLDDKKKFHDNLLVTTSEAICYVIELGGEVVGSAFLYFQHKVIRNGCIAGLIEEVVVDEKHRGKGIGEQLIKHVTRQAFDVYDCYKVILSCHGERVDFYNKCGFRKESHTMRIDNAT